MGVSNSNGRDPEGGGVCDELVNSGWTVAVAPSLGDVPNLSILAFNLSRLVRQLRKR